MRIIIFEILIYFFIVFGILQFSVCIWEFFTSASQTEDAFIIIKLTEGYPDIIRRLKKYHLKIYAVTDDAKEHTPQLSSIEYITKDEILKKL